MTGVPHRLMRRRRRHPWRGLAWIVLLIGLAWTGGLVWFAERVVPGVTAEDGQTDAIVVLTGGRNRLTEGLLLLADERADRLFVSGVYHGVDVAALLALQQAAPQELECCIELGYEADDTAGNARETGAWAGDNDIASIRLVTSAYHMPRALVAFRAAMPDITIVPHPVDSDAVPLDEWYTHPGTALLLASEYSKYLAASVGATLGLLF